MTMSFPVNIFSSNRKFNDFSASDMNCGDLNESTLKKELGLVKVSNIVDPYKLIRLTSFDNPQSAFAGVYNNKSKDRLTVNECAALLFKEIRTTSLPFSFYGRYKSIINDMLTHMQGKSGASFSSPQLNSAYEDQILNDHYPNNARNAIIRITNKHAANIEKLDFTILIREVSENIANSMLPKFDLFSDRFNGMGVSVHDIHATKIDLLDLQINKNNWHMKVKYTAQDHFGLDIKDIQNKNFKQFEFFKIWFVLQRFNRFAFQPFMTNMETTIVIKGVL